MGILGSPWPSLLVLFFSGTLAAALFPAYKRFIWLPAPALIWISVLLATALRDSSYDGLSTYAETLHWLTQSTGSLQEQKARIEFLASQTHIRGSLSLGCVFANLTGSFESSKWTGWAWSLAGACLFAASASLCLSGRGFFAWAIPGMVLLQPVLLYQGATLYQDAQIAGAITGLFASFLAVCFRCGPKAWAGFLVSLGCLVISKTFAFGYVILLLPIFWAGIFFRNRPQSGVVVVIGLLLASFLMPWGFPMLREIRSDNDGKDWSKHISQFLLFADPAAIDGNKTDGIHGGCGEVVSNSAAMFWRRHFAASKRGDEQSRIKMPFWFTRPELDVFSDLTPDLRFGGFGPLYGTAALLALLPGLLLLGSPAPTQAGWKWILVACLVMIPVSPSWWARWFPQGWWIPFAACVGFLCGPPDWREKFRWAGKLARAGLLALGLNSLLILVFTLKGYVQAESIIRKQLAFVKTLPQPVTVYWERFGGARFWLDREGIAWRASSQAVPGTAMRIYRTELDVALAPEDAARLKEKNQAFARLLGQKRLFPKP